MRLIDADALFDAIQSMLVARALGESDETIYDVVKHAPTVQMESLTARITELEQKLAHKTYHCQANLDELKRTIRMLHDKEQEFKKLESKKFAKFDNEECWIYQGDGYDNLESLACPVVINPNVLINLINAPTVQREGWVSVPIEPTEEMLRAGCEAGLDFKTLMDDTPYATDLAVYKAMIKPYVNE